jgi:hypothetical protein
MTNFMCKVLALIEIMLLLATGRQHHRIGCWWSSLWGKAPPGLPKVKLTEKYVKSYELEVLRLMNVCCPLLGLARSKQSELIVRVMFLRIEVNPESLFKVLIGSSIFHWIKLASGRLGLVAVDFCGALANDVPGDTDLRCGRLGVSY